MDDIELGRYLNREFQKYSRLEFDARWVYTPLEQSLLSIVRMVIHAIKEDFE